MNTRFFLPLLLLSLFLSPSAFADDDKADVAALRREVSQLSTRVQNLEAELRTLRGSTPPPPFKAAAKAPPLKVVAKAAITPNQNPPPPASSPSAPTNPPKSSSAIPPSATPP